MGKKKTEQDEKLNTGVVVNKDLMQRMNFLYQVASHLSQQPGEPQLTSEKRHGKRKGSPQDLAAFHVRTMRTIGNKSMVKMDPSVKRTICKVCHTVTLPGQTSHVRVRSSKSHRFVKSHACNNCGWTHRIPCPPKPQADEKKERLQATDLSQREQRSIRRALLFEREGHVVHISNETRRAEPPEARERAVATVSDAVVPVCETTRF